MIRFRKLLVSALSCCIVMSGCGRSAEDSNSGVTPFSIEQPETTTADVMDDTDQFTTTASPVVTTIEYVPFVKETTTTFAGYVAKITQPAGGGYRASAITTASKNTSSKTTATARAVTVTGSARNASGTSTTTAALTEPAELKGQYGDVSENGSGTDVTVSSVITTTSASKFSASTTSSQTTTFAGKAPMDIMKAMSLEQKVCQLLIISPQQLSKDAPADDVAPNVKTALETYPVGGFYYDDKNIRSKEQITDMLSTMQVFAKSSCGVGLFACTAEQGGNFSAINFDPEEKKLYEMSVYGSDKDKDAVRNAANTIANKLKGLGFNIDLAPVADVNTGGMCDLDSKMFSSDPELTSEMVEVFVKEMRGNGMCAAISHFPGIGACYGTTSALEQIKIDRDLKQLSETEYLPFKAGIAAGAEFVIVGHQIISGLGDDLPADLSETVITDILRGQFGYKGIVMTDSHSMPCITKNYTSGEAAVMAIKAGADIILLPSDLPETVKAICEAVEKGEISEERINESVMRILLRKKLIGLY